jgi:mRNA-degrading endonuclease RelE of RelBE toxin-antitoxin system
VELLGQQRKCGLKDAAACFSLLLIFLRQSRIITIMVFIETSIFTKYIQEYLDDDEYAALQCFLNERPEAGNIVPASGGVRKLRWAVKGRGKRGGIRVIYYWKKSEHEIWLLTAYAKNEKENIPSHVLRKIAEEIGNG